MTRSEKILCLMGDQIVVATWVSVITARLPRTLNRYRRTILFILSHTITAMCGLKFSLYLTELKWDLCMRLTSVILCLQIVSPAQDNRFTVVIRSVNNYLKL